MYNLTSINQSNYKLPEEAFATLNLTGNSDSNEEKLNDTESKTNQTGQNALQNKRNTPTEEKTEGESSLESKKKHRLVKIENASLKSVTYSIHENPHDASNLPKLIDMEVNPVTRIFLHKSKIPLKVELQPGVTSYYVTKSECVFVNAIGENEDIAIWNNRQIPCPLDKVTHLKVMKKHFAQNAE